MEKFERLERIMRTMKKERVITQDEILGKKDKERDFAKKLFGVKLQRNLRNHEKSTKYLQNRLQNVHVMQRANAVHAIQETRTKRGLLTKNKNTFFLCLSNKNLKFLMHHFYTLIHGLYFLSLHHCCFLPYSEHNSNFY